MWGSVEMDVWMWIILGDLNDDKFWITSGVHPI